MIHTGPITARLQRKLRFAIAAQPLIAIVLFASALTIGAPTWLVVVQLVYLPVALFVIVREARKFGGPRPDVFFASMATGVLLGFLTFGALRSPLTISLGTMPGGAAALAPTKTIARRMLAVFLGALLLATIVELVAPGSIPVPACVDREGTGAGLYAGTFVTFLVCLTATMMGGLSARELRAAVDEAEALESLGRTELLASIEARSRDVALLTARLSRELDAPLDAIRRRAEALSVRTLDPATKERVEVLRREVARVGERLERYLRFSRPATTEEEVDLQQLLAEVARATEGLAEARGVTMRVSDAASTTTRRTDREKLREVLENLAQNAVEASPAGEVVELRANGAKVEILDRGPGLTDAAKESLFTPGFTTKARGSGLGLALSRRIAAQLGAKLGLSPRPHGGTIAEVTFDDAP